MKLNIIAAITVAALSFTSCSDDFLRNEPQGTLSEANMNDPKAADLLVSGAYATFGCRYADSNDPHFYSITNWSHGEVRADNAYKGGGGETDIWEFHDMETAKLQPNNGLLDGKWFNVYCGISRCNSAIRALRKIDESVNKDIKTRIAEVSVIRSFWYFDLVRQFNRIPYMDIDLPETEYINVRNDEFTREQHLARIASELMEAAKNLPDEQPEIGRINRRSALALAAKVKLYQAYEEDPQTNAVININKQLLQEVVDIIDGLTVQFSKDDGSSGVGRINWGNLLNSMTGPGCPWQGDGFFLPSQDLINAYQTDENGLPVFDYQSRPDYGTVEFDADGNYPLANVDGNVDPRLDFVTGRPTITYKTYKDAPCGLWVRNPDTYGYNNTKRFWLSPESPDAQQGWPWGASALNWQLIRYADLLLYKAEALIEIGGDGLELGPLIGGGFRRHVGLGLEVGLVISHDVTGLGILAEIVAQFLRVEITGIPDLRNEFNALGGAVEHRGNGICNGCKAPGVDPAHARLEFFQRCVGERTVAFFVPAYAALQTAGLRVQATHYRKQRKNQ